MRVEANIMVISLVAVTTVLFCSLSFLGSPFDAFGIDQKSPTEAAKSVVVHITVADANYMNALDGSVLVLEDSSDNKYRSSPIAVIGKTGDCEFKELILPGKYKLIVDVLRLQMQVDISPTNNTVDLDMNISPKGISLRVRVSGNSEIR